MFVLAFRGLSLLSADRSAGMETLAAELLSAIGILDGGGFKFSGGLCSTAGLLDSGLLRGFGGETTGGGIVFNIDRGSIGTGGGGGCKISTGLGDDEIPELAVLGRLAGGGVLITGHISTCSKVKVKIKSSLV